MQTRELMDLWDRLEAVRADVLRLLEDATEPELAWAPPGFRNPAAVIGRHLAGAEKFWIGQLVGGTDVKRQRDLEFSRPLWTRAALLEELSRTRDLSARVFRGLDASSLDRRVETLVHRPPHAPEDMTARWAILHTLEHESYHLGQLSVLLRAARAGAARADEVAR